MEQILRPILEDSEQKGIMDSEYEANGDKYFNKNDRRFSIRQASANGIHLISRSLLAGILGNSLYLYTVSRICNPSGLLLGSGRPFRNIPFVKWVR